MDRRLLSILVFVFLLSWRFSAVPSPEVVWTSPPKAQAHARPPLFAPHVPVEHGVTVEEKEEIPRRFRQGIVLVKLKGEHPQALAVEIGREREMLRALHARPEVEFAELDYVLTRQFAPSDPQRTGQWHHGKIGSTNAWAISIGYGAARQPLVRVAIMDTPFQMNHPDLQAHTVLGWSMIRSAPNVFDTNGYYHSTIAAGIAGAVINNATGVSGMVNCVLTPVDIGDQPTTSDMYNAVVWAADQGIRVVNLSWDGAFSAVINDAGAYLKQKARGMLFMSGVNGSRLLPYSAHPHIYAVSMTDQEDQARSSSGNHIDFAAPGWELYSTTTNSSYEVDSGTSYSAPMLAGITAWIMSAAPDLGPAEIEEILKTSCVDLGAPGWDQQFGWGRIDFARVARETFQRTNISRVATQASREVEALYEPGAEYKLFRSETLIPGSWELVGSPVLDFVDKRVILRDPEELAGRAFYKVEITRPR